MLIESFLLLEDDASFLLLEDGVSLLLLDSTLAPDVPETDHQWDNKIVPILNSTVAIHIRTGDTYLVTKLIRYNRRPSRKFQYCCHVLNQVNGKAGKADVWYDVTLATWYCDTYLQHTYRDYDGRKKKM